MASYFTNWLNGKTSRTNPTDIQAKLATIETTNPGVTNFYYNTVGDSGLNGGLDDQRSLSQHVIAPRMKNWTQQEQTFFSALNTVGLSTGLASGGKRKSRKTKRRRNKRRTRRVTR